MYKPFSRLNFPVIVQLKVEHKRETETFGIRISGERERLSEFNVLTKFYTSGLVYGLNKLY